MMIDACLLLIIFCHLSLCLYDQTDVTAGIKLSANEEMIVTASNAFSNFAIVFDPMNRTEINPERPCNNLRYNTTDRFVHSVAVVGRKSYVDDSNGYVFVFTAEQMSTATPYVCIVIISRLTCLAQTQCTTVAPAGSHQEYFLIGVDSDGNFAYGLTNSFVFKLELATNRMVAFLTTNDVWPSLNFIPHAIEIKNSSWGLVAGYGYSNIQKRDYAALGCLLDLDSLVNASCAILIREATYLVPADVSSYNELYEMSVSIQDDTILVGIHRLNAVVVLSYQNRQLNVTDIHSVSDPALSSFGRGVAWSDAKTFALLAYESSRSPWSKSQLFFFHQESVSLTKTLFTFPNNQQILGARLRNPYFARFVIVNRRYMVILTGRSDILIVPIAAPGFTSTWIDTSALIYLFYYEAKPCIGGTFKNTSGLGPCHVCPPGMRNPGSLIDSGVACIPCSDYPSSSFCPLASLMDLNKSRITSYTQAVAYPDSPETTDIEDLLLENVFQIKSDPSCIVLSPLFWTLMVGTLCFLIWLMIVSLKYLECKQYDRYRKHAKKIFQHTDIIGEGELWVGGLVTVAILVLISLSYWFLIAFVGRYPIEEVFDPATFSCDRSLANAKFSTGLEVVSIPKSAEAQPIFTLLDGQQFHLTIDLINSGYMCSNVTAQENLIDGKFVRLPTRCVDSVSNSTTAVTVTFPGHFSTVQINMTGPYWIGGFRLCIRGDGRSDGATILQRLDFCQFYYTERQAIDRSTQVPITFVKSINMTKPLNKADSNTYSGLWIPAFTDLTFADEAYYQEFGNYLRYTSSLTTIQVRIDERAFYIKNTQEPIVRVPQAIFHALLFTFLCIELFAFPFVLGKLFLVPLFKSLQRRWKKHQHRHSAEHVNEEFHNTPHVKKESSISVPGDNPTSTWF